LNEQGQVVDTLAYGTRERNRRAFEEARRARVVRASLPIGPRRQIVVFWSAWFAAGAHLVGAASSINPYRALF